MMPAIGAMSRRKFEIELVVERRVDCIRRPDNEQRIAVRWRIDDRLGGEIAARSWPVLNDKGLAQAFRERLAHEAGKNVLRASRRKTNDNARWSGRERLGFRYARDD